jgi:hypothetical protein
MSPRAILATASAATVMAVKMLIVIPVSWIGIQLVYPPHELLILLRLSFRGVVRRGPGNIQQAALLGDRYEASSL